MASRLLALAGSVGNWAVRGMEDDGGEGTGRTWWRGRGSAARWSRSEAESCPVAVVIGMVLSK